jgi:hypothetical protein
LIAVPSEIRMTATLERDGKRYRVSRRERREEIDYLHLAVADPNAS